MWTKEIEYTVYNRMEEIADLVLEKLLDQKSNLCKCERCLNDMRAIILNSLPADYVPVDEGKPLHVLTLDGVPASIVDRALQKAHEAVEIVQKSPRHDEVNGLTTLHNVSEGVLLSALPEVLQERVTLCTCPQCMSRVMANALNNMKPRYTTTCKGDAYARVDEVDSRYLAHVYAVLFNALEWAEQQCDHSS